MQNSYLSAAVSSFLSARSRVGDRWSIMHARTLAERSHFTSVSPLVHPTPTLYTLPCSSCSSFDFCRQRAIQISAFNAMGQTKKDPEGKPVDANVKVLCKIHCDLLNIYIEAIRKLTREGQSTEPLDEAKDNCNKAMIAITEAVGQHGCKTRSEGRDCLGIS